MYSPTQTSRMRFALYHTITIIIIIIITTDNMYPRYYYNYTYDAVIVENIYVYHLCVLYLYIIFVTASGFWLTEPGARVVPRLRSHVVFII